MGQRTYAPVIVGAGFAGPGMAIALKKTSRTSPASPGSNGSKAGKNSKERHHDRNH
jgi:thioredoxin reductase